MPVYNTFPTDVYTIPAIKLNGIYEAAGQNAAPLKAKSKPAPTILLDLIISGTPSESNTITFELLVGRNREDSEKFRFSNYIIQPNFIENSPYTHADSVKYSLNTWLAKLVKALGLVYDNKHIIKLYKEIEDLFVSDRYKDYVYYKY